MRISTVLCFTLPHLSNYNKILNCKIIEDLMSSELNNLCNKYESIQALSAFNGDII